MNLSIYEDLIRRQRGDSKCEEQFSPYCDFRYVDSTITKGVRFAIKVIKPAKPSSIIAGTHGWHMSVDAFEHMEQPTSEYLRVLVDMRGRAFSTGSPDCNGYELYDVYDAINFVKKEYADYISDPDVVYFESGSGGGGNALAIAGKFPDLFCAVNALVPISDYYDWYEFDDKIMEFRDEMDVWIAPASEKTKEAYAARSGITLVPNLLTKLLIVHSSDDLRVPCFLSRKYINAAAEAGKRDNVKLYVLHNTGGREHFENITPAQERLMRGLCRNNIKRNIAPPVLPDEGELVVGGYIVTKRFAVFLDSIDRVARIKYSVPKKQITIIDKADVGKEILWND